MTVLYPELPYQKTKVYCCRICGVDGDTNADWRYLSDVKNPPYWICSDECARMMKLNPLAYGV